MSLISAYKQQKRQFEYKANTQIYKIKVWILDNIIGKDDIEEYCIDRELLADYYNEEPDYEDYRNDYY